MIELTSQPPNPEWSRLGTPGDAIEVVPYDPAWSALFEQEATRIRTACAPRLLAIEHIGSTAVPGLPAKPVLDLMPGLARFEDGPQLVDPMQRLGYQYYGEHGIPGRHYFVLRYSGCAIIHVHMFPAGSHDWRRHLLFRDTLRSNPDLASRYATLKQDLARQFRSNRSAYTDGKSTFIQSVLAAAGWPC